MRFPWSGRCRFGSTSAVRCRIVSGTVSERCRWSCRRNGVIGIVPRAGRLRQTPARGRAGALRGPRRPTALHPAPPMMPGSLCSGLVDPCRGPGRPSSGEAGVVLVESGCQLGAEASTWSTVRGRKSDASCSPSCCSGLLAHTEALVAHLNDTKRDQPRWVASPLQRGVPGENPGPGCFRLTSHLASTVRTAGTAPSGRPVAGAVTGTTVSSILGMTGPLLAACVPPFRDASDAGGVVQRADRGAAVPTRNEPAALRMPDGGLRDEG